MLMHPMKPELVGNELSDMKDPNGFAVFSEMMNMMKKQDSARVDYLWPKPGSSQPVRKTSYVKNFKPWGWIVGTGLYLDDVEAATSRALRDAFIGLALIFLAAGVFAFYFSSLLAR